VQVAQPEPQKLVTVGVGPHSPSYGTYKKFVSQVKHALEAEHVAQLSLQIMQEEPLK